MLHVIFFFLAFTTCSLPVLAIGSGPSVAQSAGSSVEKRRAAEKPSK